LQGFVLTGLEARTEKKIFQGMPAQDAMDQHSQCVPLKINPIIADPEPVQQMATTFQFPEILQFTGDHMLRQPAKIAQDLQLQFLWHPRQFRRAGWREYDLKGAHQVRPANSNASPPNSAILITLEKIDAASLSDEPKPSG